MNHSPRTDSYQNCQPSARRSRQVGLLLLAFALLLTGGCSGGKESKGPKGGKGAETGKGKGQPVPVTVATSVRKDMPVELAAIGSVEPFATVGIKSQVAGVLEKVNFREGDPVQAGELLFVIDPRPFAARLSQIQANLAKDQAALANARKQAERYGPAAEKGYVSEEQSDQAQTSVATLAAVVQADTAAVESARLDLENCTIRSPLAGVAGDLLTDQGNLVKAAADLPLVTINQISPVKVSFSLPEQSLPELKKSLAARSLEVQASLPGAPDKSLVGKFSFLDNSVDASTGTIRLKATFANAERNLWPGQFVNVRLLLSTRQAATVVPVPAVQTGQNGTYIYVVKPDATVELRPVTVGFTVGGETLIEAGLAVGEKVVTDGQLRLTPGATIKLPEAGGQGVSSARADQADRSDKVGKPGAAR
ncbi:MAG: efflux RND transporter periplasmic adaptor subunit [Desulfobulbaceae bacterium]|nr:efflux RND transporter periplasmic adaptor subunit [Desulfobulbaceae bacterium]